MRKLVALLSIILLSSSIWADAAAVPEPDSSTNTKEKDESRWVEKTLQKMSLEEKIGQMLMPWAKVDFMNFSGADYGKLHDMMRKYHVGSFAVTVPVTDGLLMKSLPLEAAALTNRLQKDSELPLLMAADFERGITMRFNGGTTFPHAMAFGATGNTDYAYKFGRITAEESRAIGVHWNFYPDADVNSNPNNPIINTRAFGEDPEQVSEMVKAYIRGTHDGGGLATAKHFPGHGDTDVDTHLAVARVNGDRARLDRVELAPFRSAIEAGVDSVMVAHVAVPAIEPDPNKVATVSTRITTDLLKHQLGFKGIVITDAMDMLGVLRLFGNVSIPQASGRAAVEAVKAGTDVVLIPADLDGAYNGLLAAARSGEIPQSRINESVRKLLVEKAKLGLHRNRMVDLNAVADVVGKPENVALGQKIADEAVTVIRDNHRVWPLQRSGTAAPAGPYHPAVPVGNRLLLLVFTDDVRSDSGRVLVREVRVRVPEARVMFIDEQNAQWIGPQVLEASLNAERVVAAVSVIPSAGRTANQDGSGSLALAKGASAVLGNVLKAATEKTAVVALGNPFVITSYPLALNYVCTFSNSQVSEVSAARFLFGEIQARGHSPVTIPGVTPRTAALSSATQGANR